MNIPCRLPVTPLLAAFLGLLAGCARLQTTPIPAGLSPGTAASAARLTEDRKHPLILRGVDRQPVPFRVYMPALVTHHYLLAPGKHILWLHSPADVLGTFPIPVGPIHCYVVEVELAADQTYLLKENPRATLAELVDEAGRVVATGQLVDEFRSGSRSCQWP